MKIIKEELQLEESLKQRLEFICAFSKVNPIFINGSIRNIENEIRQNPYFYQDKYLEYVHPKKKSKQYKIYKFIGNFNKIKKLNGIDILFLTLFYLMGILPKNNPRHKPISPEMRQGVRKLERYSSEFNLL